MSEKSGGRKYVEDKVYLQGPDGRIWEYESLLASIEGYKSVVPNPSKGNTEKQKK